MFKYPKCINYLGKNVNSSTLVHKNRELKINDEFILKQVGNITIVLKQLE